MSSYEAIFNRGWVAAVYQRLTPLRRGVAPVVRVGRHRHARRAGRLLGVLAVAAVGMVLAVLVAGRVHADVGPFHARLAITPAVDGGTDVAIPPLGSLHLSSHSGPAHLSVQLEALDEQRTKALVTNPNALSQASSGVVEDLRTGVVRLIFQVAGVSVLGAMLLAALLYRSMRRVAAVGGAALAILAGTALVSLGTFRPSAIAEPRYEGLLVNAPAVVGDARQIASRYTAYRAQLQQLVGNVGKLYGAVSTLPLYEPDNSTIRVLHISDMHLNPAAWSVVQTVVKQFNIGVVIDTGDITDWGSEPEDSYVSSIAALKVPYVYVRGNHDSARTQAAVAKQPNAKVLDGGTVTVDGLTIAGIGDPEFTPDKSSPGNAPGGQDKGQLQLNSGQLLANSILEMEHPPNVALVHDPAAAPPLAGRVPLVLSGHLHKREVRRLDNPTGTKPDAARTLHMIEGSTGGAGLRGLEGKEPTPLALSVLYFDTKQHTLQAYDDITVGGTGQTEVSLQRHLIKDDKGPAPAPSASPSS
ncbi:metallophosphoesterase family protein [Planosporangium mesophilum]|uniref:Membrane protein n=1 Tax=Planosporangium mesophilum TaxID=689768 RepID=A0A8J3T6U5_9ACTN|nr:metallophosphoesterase [Planosporangium mesophilum]NJC81602.1 metallophosphoesterase [Planosporangium mesophilum]GII20738.1 membrane protein [Planosporangium mesophilum]